MRKPQDLLRKMREELRALEVDRKAMDKRIEGLRVALDAYNATSAKTGARAQDFDFRTVAKEIFTEAGNQPMRVKELVLQIHTKHPELTKQQIRTKIVYAVRPAAKALVKSEYGKYTFYGLTPAQPLAPSQQTQ